MIQNIINKGTGAGGKNTNHYGKIFENKTNNEVRLSTLGYDKFYFNEKKNSKNKNNYIGDYYYSKSFEDKNIIFVSQNGLKKYMKTKYNIDLFRFPDEAYLIEYKTGKKILKILEKKEQHVNGSVETKLWSAPSLKREYELILGVDFEVHYGICINHFLKQKIISLEDKKYMTLNTILNENNIITLFGDDENYFETLDSWITTNNLL